MNNKDKRLLETLAEDARKPIKRIARDAGVSREVADYRIKKLEQGGVIRGYQTRLFQPKYFLILTSKKDYDHFLQNKKYPHWLGKASGTFDAFLSTISENILDVVNELHSYSDDLKLKVLTIKEEYTDTFLPLFTDEWQLIKNKINNEKLDDKDKEILRLLCNNARISSSEIAKKINLTSEAVRYRIKQLEKNVITNYRTIVDVSKLGFKQYQLLLKFSNLTKENELKIKNYFEKNKNTLYAARTLGEFDVVATMFAEDARKLNNVLKNLRMAFGNLEELQTTELLEVPIFRTVCD